jgi:hypothetical protein
VRPDMAAARPRPWRTGPGNPVGGAAPRGRRRGERGLAPGAPDA